MQQKIYGTLILTLLFFSSCVSHKELINFRTGEEPNPTLTAAVNKQDILNQADLKLQPNDVIAIIVASPADNLATPYNIVPGQGAAQVMAPTAPNTFIINTEGVLDLPGVGTVKAAGMSITELRQEVLKRVSVYLENPSVNVRLVNFKVSVLGEVGNPGVLNIDNERITILEALARAGDLTPYSNRRHVLVIRESNGTRETAEIDLKDTKFFSSPYYYLRQNDVVYVEPTKAKIAQIQQPVNVYLQPVQVGISILAIVIALFR